MQDDDDLLYDEEEEEDAQKDKYLTFHLGKEIYGIEIGYVTEIVGIQKITQVPDMPNFIKGVVNLRGQIIPVMDVRIRFHMKTRTYDDRTCLIVVNADSTLIGLVVDTVNEVAEIPEEKISPPSKIGRGKSNRYIKGMGRTNQGVRIILNIEKLLFEKE
jgi:purine-binding chemotaxis protein CheW